MSWWVYLQHEDGTVVSVDSHTEGGTYAPAGSPLAELNVTYNYSQRFKEAFDGVGFKDMLHEKRARDVVEALDYATVKLGTVQYPDYWAPTAGNAGHALSVLSDWAKQHPDATFVVS